MNNQKRIEMTASKDKISLLERILIIGLFGYFFEMIMLYRTLECALDDISKFWCLVLPYPEEFIEIVMINISIGIVSSICFYWSFNKNNTLNLRQKLLLLSPYLQLSIFILIAFLTSKYV